MVTQSVRLPEELAQRLEALARYLDEREDLEVALARFRDPAAEWVDHDQVKRELGFE